MTDRDPIFLIEHFDPKEDLHWQTINSQWSRRNVVEGIYDSVLDCPSKVWEIRKAEGTCRNVTRDIAEEVETYGLRNHDGQFSYRVLTFLQTNGLRQQQMAER